MTYECLAKLNPAVQSTTLETRHCPKDNDSVSARKDTITADEIYIWHSNLIMTVIRAFQLFTFACTAAVFQGAYCFTVPPPQRNLATVYRRLPPSTISSKRVQISLWKCDASPTQLSASTGASNSQAGNDEDIPSFSFNPIAGTAWLALVLWAFSNVAPGSLGSPEDAALLNNIIANPAHPAGMNELYYLVFNMFAVVPVWLACLLNPQGQPNKGLPSAPFLAAASGIGFFALGIFLTLRAPPRTQIDDDCEISWVTRNILENKLFAWSAVLFTLYLPIACNVFPAYQADPVGLVRGFWEFCTSSRFAAVSLVDIILLYASAVAVTPRDYLLRNPEATPSQAQQVALGTALLPFLGTALYCATRPALPIIRSKD